LIILYHNGTTVIQVMNEEGTSLSINTDRCATAFFEIADQHPEDWIIWCHNAYKKIFKPEIIQKELHHKAMMISQSVGGESIIPPGIDYIEENPFMKVSHGVHYPTWMMHSDIGAIHAQASSSDEKIMIKSDRSGLSHFESYRFVKEYYKIQWVFFLFLSEWIYEKRLAILPLLFSLFSTKKQVPFHIDQATIASTKQFKEKPTVDVIIPTMGRASFLHDVLKDMATQTYLPEKVIIVEQDADPEGNTQLRYIKETHWPFEIIHHFIHQTGACNARNIALAETDADWVFFADDDNRLDPDTIKNILSFLEQYGASVLTTSYLQKGERKVFMVPKQWNTFGSGNSMVRGDLARRIDFDTAYEHGYGEDTDYGMQLRNIGADILYHPEVDLLHLKAPVGGFRKKIQFPWENESYQPKPSPTVMLYRLRHTTLNQLKGYKLRLFLRQLKAAKTINIFAFIKQFKAKWNTSIKWATYLDRQ